MHRETLGLSKVTTSARRTGHQFAAIPQELRDLDQWVGWRGEWRVDASGKRKWTKIPTIAGTDANASSTNPETWCSFEAALDAYEAGVGSGLGFVFTANDSFVGVDLDHARDKDTGMVAVWAQDIIDNMDSYTEVSPSGTGVHIIVRGTLPNGRRRKDDVEMYSTGRFFCMTGAVIT